MLLDVDPTYKSADAKYVRFNFHTQAQVDRLADIFRSEDRDRPRVIVLAGEEQSGRRYLAEAAVYQAGKRGGAPVRYCRLDLEGYEEREGSLDAFVTHQLTRLPGASASRGRQVADKLKLQLKVQAPSLWFASLLSIALSMDVPIGELAAAFGESFDSLPGGTRSSRERFSLALEQLAGGGRLIIHVLDPSALSHVLHAWLLEELADNANLVVVFSARRKEDVDTGTGTVASSRFELTRLGDSEIRAALDERFSPNELSSDVVRALWYYSDGFPGRIALKMADLVSQDAITEDRDRTWRLREGTGGDGYDLADVFGVDEGERVRLALDRIEAPATRGEVKRFLTLASLCGEAIPVRAVARRVGIDDEALDEFIDVLDEAFDPPMFEDEGYAHPSFPGELIYRFVNPVTAAVLARRVPDGRREQIAAALLKDLRSTKGVQTRGMWTLCLALARHCSPSVRQEFERSFAWWSSEEEADELAKVIRRQVLSGRLDGRTVLRGVNRRYINGWSVYKCLAIVQALIDEDGGLPVAPEEVSGFLYFYSFLLTQNDQDELALQVAETALRSVPERSRDAALLRRVCATACRGLAQPSAAVRHLEQARAILRELDGDVDPYLQVIERELASVLKDVERFDEAERLHHHVASIEEARGPSGTLLWGLADWCDLYIHLKRHDDAEAVLARGVDTLEQLLGGEQPATARLRHDIVSNHENAERLDLDAAELPEAPDDSDASTRMAPASAYKSWTEFFQVWETQLGASIRRALDSGRYSGSPVEQDLARTWNQKLLVMRLRRLTAEYEQQARQ